MRAGWLALVICWGVAAGAEAPAFEVASVKASSAPGRAVREFKPQTVTLQNESLLSIVARAYGVGAFQVSGPDWLRNTNYDVFAKAPEAVPYDQMKLMLQTLLTQRFKLEFHREMRPLDVTVMTVGKNGAKLQPSESNGAPEMKSEADKGRIVYKSGNMTELATIFGMTTIDMTGIKGRYDIVLDYAKYMDSAAERTMSIVFDAFREAAEVQLGLKFTDKRTPVEVLVIDRVEKVPTEN